MKHTQALSHYNDTMSIAKSHYHEIEIAGHIAKIWPMSEIKNRSDIKQEIAQRHRAAIRRVMAMKNLEVSSWCTSAGLANNTLTNFLLGHNLSMNSFSLNRLASAAGVTVGQLLGEAPLDSVDEILMKRSWEAIQRAAKEQKRKLDDAEMLAYTVMLYKTLAQPSEDGSATHIQPNISIANLILKQKVVQG